MDRIKEGANAIAQLNKYRRGKISDSELIATVLSCFDKIKQEKLSIQDLKFLKYISNIVGVPHYFDMLSKFKQDVGRISEFDLNTLSAFIYESTLHKSDNVKVHRYQKEIIDLFKREQLNRFFLSASTSFGKTFVVYEIIKKMQYKNIVLIFPTIALLSENLEKLVFDKYYLSFRIHTLSDVCELGDKNLFVFTPERFLSFVEKNTNPISFDFVFIDEAYKMDNEYFLDEITKENERDVAYRIATHYSLLNNSDILLAGPYIEFSELKTNSFNIFLEKNRIKLLNFNRIEIVGKSYHEIKSSKKLEIDNNFIIEFDSTKKESRLLSILTALEERKENTIMYCSTKPWTEKYAKAIVGSNINNNWDISKYADFIQHLKTNFHEDWILIKGLENGIGIHHGLIPKYIQKEMIYLFNEGSLSTLLSTTTITEGVNTSAKNLIVLHDKKGNKDLKKFDAANISGRAGRFLSHFSGRVIILQNKFMDAINAEPEEIKHKNYDISSLKDEIDLFYTDNQFLNENDINKKIDIEKEQKKRKIPDDVMQRFKVVSRKDKIQVYDNIKKLTPSERTKIRKLVSKIHVSSNIEFDGLQTILNLLEPIIKNEKLKWMIEYKIFSSIDSRKYSIFVYLLHFYLRDGFRSSINYKIEKQGKETNVAIRETADFIFNTLKYQAVKYLGVFNLMYKFIRSYEENKEMDDVVGIDKLLLKLEYNALTEKGRLASDYGVPYKVLEFYEDSDFANEIKNGFDNYENKVFNQIERIINNEKKE